MSIQAINWAFKQRVGKPSAKLVLVNLADHADHERKCWPSLRTISARTELSRDTVVRSIRLLESKGFITVVHRRDGRSSQSNMYYLSYKPEPVNPRADVSAPSEKHSSTVRPSQASGTATAVASSDQHSSSTRTAVSALSAPNHHIESSKEASSEGPKESYKEGKKEPPTVPQRGTSTDEFNLAKEWLNKLFGRKRAWSREEDHLLLGLLPISPEERALLSWGYGLPSDPAGWVYMRDIRLTRRKKHLLTFLREFASEVDKWRSVSRRNGIAKSICLQDSTQSDELEEL